MSTAASDASPIEYEHTNMFAKRGCCFWMPCLGSNPSPSSSSLSYGFVWWERMRAPETDDHWLTRGWKKLREWSEIVAGPRWKTFIRRFNKNRKQSTFQYDPLSYALNFDEGKFQNGEDDYYREFSTRYASIPASAKSSMDLGKDGPTFS